ncbi:MAG: molybdopterin-dependent oxidoreductase [Chloroflexales bacterium]|nr:molybdopterin-dependent oxidoreductase [Chloroflexales bacterium]
MTNTPPKRWRVTRRGFLIGLGGASVLTLGWAVGLPIMRMAISEMVEGTEKPYSRGAPKVSPTVWFTIHADNKITLNVQKIEMGQGILTALAQIAADELDIAWERISVHMANTGSGVDDANGTGNSESVVSHYLPLRQAAATLTIMLKTEAARQLGVPIENLSIKDASITASDGRSLTYGSVVAAHRGDWLVPKEAPMLKLNSTFRYIGKSQPRVDLPDKVTGKIIYGHDMRLPNMLWGAVARPLKFGATISSVDPKNAASMPGVHTVVVEQGFVGVAAETKTQAQTALNAMDIVWQEPAILITQQAIEDAVTVDPNQGVVIQHDGDPEAILHFSSLVIGQTYRTPMAVHAHLEPQAAIVDVRDDGIDAWVSTQVPSGMASGIAGAIGRNASQVTVHPVFIGGGFGRRLDATLGAEAARLSAAAKRPVMIQWSRAEEFRNGYVRPPTHHVMQGSVNEEGFITVIAHHQASGDVLLPIFPGLVGDILGWDIGAVRGAKLFYTAKVGKQTVAQRVKLPIATSFWRGLGLLADGFAIESFIDELAKTVNMDPLAFRLKNLPDTPFGNRMKRVLQAVADLAKWGTPLRAGRAYGIACSADAGTCVAQIAEVSVSGNIINVHHVYAAVDAGLVINPDGVNAQTEGGIMMGVSSTLIEEFLVVDGGAGAVNFDKYPLLRNSQAPDISVVIVGDGDAPGGMGEPPIGPVAGAIGNAVFALTGQRLTSLPLRLI